MNLQEELKSLKERIAELEKQEKEEREFPQYGDKYWCIGTTGDVVNEKWEGFGIEKDMLEIGNIFKTEEQAEFAAEKLKVEAELRKFNRPFKFQSSNYSIELLTWVNRLSIDAGSRIQHQGTIYFESEEKAQQAIQSVGEERIKKYIFGVED